ncbi:MFS transporter [Marinicrinis sediminis]|uniref:MFS transporter n=1 Tax=Marinicrinis sediminis TaxID=1652465 RepID=A0ABW5RD38_9BACL
MSTNKQHVRAWVMYDWANSAFAATMMAAVLPVFYSEVAAAPLEDHVATSYWGFTQTIAMVLMAVMAPVLGAVADYSGLKMRFLRFFALMGILASAGFVFVGEGDYILASGLFIFGLVGFSNANTFYDGLLPDLVPDEQRDRVSSQGFAFGYIGGGLLLVLNLLWIQKPEWFGIPDTLTGTRISFLSVALWWLLFSLPLMRRVRDTRRHGELQVRQYARIGFSRIWHTLRHLRQYPELLKFMLAFWFFNDGISTIITMATIYGKEIGIGTSDLIGALVITQFVGIPFTLLLGKLADRWGSKRTLTLSLWVYVLIVLLGALMTSALHFYLLAFMVGLVQGGSQALSRSIYSKMIPKERAAEFFGFLNLSSKFSAIVGPLVFSTVGLLTGSSRWGILALLLFFIAGIVLLAKVNIEKGKSQAV